MKFESYSIIRGGPKMKNKIRKKLVWDEKGVSEIIADILILSMTVVLFAIIFAFVWGLPTPNESTYADLDGGLILDATGGRVNITHGSGEDLPGDYTKIYIIKNAGLPSQEVRELNLISGSGDIDNPSGYGITGDNTWSPGETWTYYISGITSSDTVEVRVVDTKQNSLIMSAKLLGSSLNDAPIIMERWYSPTPGANASTLYINTRVKDPDGYGDISTPGYIYAEVASLNKTYTILNLKEVSHTADTGLFSGNLTVDKGIGIYTITLHARDSLGLEDSARLMVDITHTVFNAPRILERWSIPEVGVNGTDITVYCRVEDMDGYDNIDYVTVNIGPIEDPLGADNIVNMVDPEADGIFEYSTLTYVARGDQFRLNFSAMDITSLEGTGHLNVSVSRFKPVIARTWTVPVTGMDEDAMTISAEVFEPDGYSDILEVLVNASSLDPSLGWEIMTDPEEDGIFEFDLILDVTTGGNKSVTFIARDTLGNDVEAQMKVFVSTRNAPVIMARWTDPNFPDNNSYVRVFARVTDEDGYEDINFTDAVRMNIAELNRSMSFADGWVNMTDSNWDGNFIYIPFVDQEAGSYTLYFSATDMGGNVANATLNVTILPYRPRFLSVWTNPQVGRNGTEIQIFANVMDPNGYMDIYYVSVDIAQLNESMNQSQPYWVNMTDYNQNGTFSYTMQINVSETDLYTLNFEVMDMSGNMANMSHQLLVTSYKPTILDAWYDPAPAINGTNVTIFVWTYDGDGTSDITSVIINVSALNTNLTWVNMTDPDSNNIFQNVTLINGINATGVYNTTIIVTDSTGNSYNKTLQIEVVLAAEAESEEKPTVFGLANPNAVGGGSFVYFSAYARNGSLPEEKISQVRFWWEGVPYYMDRIFENYFRYANSIQAPLVGESNAINVDVDALNATGGVVATDTIRLLVLYDETGGEVNKGTALQKNVAWIAYDQGFVITNNKTSNKTVQVFETFDVKDRFCHVKIGSNSITNTEKVNIFRLTSRTTGEVIEYPYIPDDLKFEYDGVLAGYWFFNLSFSTDDLYKYVTDNIPGKFPVGTNAEYFDVYMYIKDTTDDYFMTESWIVITESGTPDFYPYLQFYYDPDYTPGVAITDGDGDKIPDDGVSGPVSDFHTFQNTEIVYVEIVTETTDSASDVTFTNLEIQDFWGNHMISNPPDTGAVGPISTHTVGGETHYIVAVDLLRSDKDPWLFGKVAYTVIISGFKENAGDLEEFTYLAQQVIIESPSSVMDLVSGHEHAGGGTWTPKYHGHFYENRNGYFDKYLYAFQEGAKGNDDFVGEIWTVAFDDLDQDSDREIVTGRAGLNNPTLSIWENFGEGHFEERIIDDNLGSEIHSVAIGHVDKLGSLEPMDIVIGTSGGDVIYYRNDGSWDQTATIASGVGTVSIGHALEIADLDRDGDGDVVVGTSTGVKIIRNPTVGGGGWTLINLHNPGTVMSVAIGFLEEDYGTATIEDPYPDIVIGDADGDVWRYLNDDSDITAGSWDSNTIDTNVDGNNKVYVDIGNINGLRYNDVVVGCDDTLLWYENIDGGTTFVPSANILGTLPAPQLHDITAVRVGNIDGAIEDDIAISTTGASQGQDATGGIVYYYRNLGRASDWKRFTVDSLERLGAEMDIYSIEMGDGDLGS
jgi:FlaG/FlaF family flagellin (archaellin)